MAHPFPVEWNRWVAAAIPRMALPPWTSAAVLAALLIFLGLLRRGPLDGHEVLVAQTARELLQNGDPIVPRFAGEVRLQKPPLAYWLAAISFRVTGVVDARTARLPSAVAALLLVGLVGHMGTRWFGARAGTAGAFLQAGSLWGIHFGGLAVVDMALATLVTAAIFCVVADVHCPGAVSWQRVIGFWLASALAVLAKGPVALVIIAPPVLVSRWLLRHETLRIFRRPAGIVGLAAFLILVSAWPVAVLLRCPEAGRIWYEQSAGRFWTHYGPNTRPWYYYLYQVPVWTLPATPFYLLGFRRTIAGCSVSTKAPGSRAIAILTIWFGAALVFFTLSAGKREHYILPALAPLSLFGGIELGRLWSRRRGRLALGIGGGLWLVALLVAEWIQPLRDARADQIELLNRNRSRLSAASQLIEYGAADHWAIFLVDQPMRWPRMLTAFADDVTRAKDCLVLVRASHWDDAAATVPLRPLDRSGTRPSDWILAQPLLP